MAVPTGSPSVRLGLRGVFRVVSAILFLFRFRGGALEKGLCHCLECGE